MVAAPLSISPVPYPASASPLLQEEGFGVIVKGVQDINNPTEEEFAQIERLLYTHGVIVFPDVDNLTPQGQFKLNNLFDPHTVAYGHGTGTLDSLNLPLGRPDSNVKAVLPPSQRTIPGTPVQIIGNGFLSEPKILQGLQPIEILHPSHETFHKTVLTKEQSEHGLTRFFRWHIDAAFYDLNPPITTTLHALEVPEGPSQTLLYDDGSGDQLEVPMAGTAFVSGKIMFDILPAPLKSVAVRTRVHYAPLPYIWMSAAKSNSVGLGMVSEGKEVPREDLPPWEEEKIKVFPLLWKNPVTGNLHFQVHPSGVEALTIDPLLTGANAAMDTLYAHGAHLSDVKEVRDLLYKMQRPAIDPSLIYTHSWRQNDLCIFHNRGVMHAVQGALKKDDKRAFWQCNLASPDEPVGPNEADIAKYA